MNVTPVIMQRVRALGHLDLDRRAGVDAHELEELRLLDLEHADRAD